MAGNGANGTFPVGCVVDGFQIMEQVGAGGFSRVHCALHLPTRNYCAAKVVDTRSLTDTEFACTMREVSILLQIDHPNIVHLYHLAHSDTHMVFFLEYAAGTLAEYIRARGALEEGDVRRLFSQLFVAVRHMHTYHLLSHRDLKCENVLLDASLNVKLTDFGLSSTFYNNVMKTQAGTPGFQAPEIMQTAGGYTEAADCWSLGVVLATMFLGRPPFVGSGARGLIEEVAALIAEWPAQIPEGARDLLTLMWTVDPEKRPSLVILQNHPWLRVAPLRANIVAQPLHFYRLELSQIGALRRSKIGNPDPKVLAKLQSTKVDLGALPAPRVEVETSPGPQATTSSGPQVEAVAKSTEAPVVSTRTKASTMGRVEFARARQTILAELLSDDSDGGSGVAVGEPAAATPGGSSGPVVQGAAVVSAAPADGAEGQRDFLDVDQMVAELGEGIVSRVTACYFLELFPLRRLPPSFAKPPEKKSTRRMSGGGAALLAMAQAPRTPGVHVGGVGPPLCRPRSKEALTRRAPLPPPQPALPPLKNWREAEDSIRRTSSPRMPRRLTTIYGE